MTDVKNEGIWRWNADPVYLQTCSMFQENHFASTAPHDFARQHHTRACLFFAVGAVESLLNRRMRASMEAGGIAEDAIIKELRFTKLMKKIKQWPSAIAGHAVALSDEFFQVFDYLKELRDEITHEKRRDHSLYAEIDAYHTRPAVNAIVEGIVAIETARGEPFHYWLLGWSHVGLNVETQPVALSNSEFKHSMNNLGFKIPAWDYNAAKVWEIENMSDLNGYRSLKRALDHQPRHIEPRSSHFPTRPRLCRRWWDRRLILNDEQPMEVPRWVRGWGVIRRQPWHFVRLFNNQEDASRESERLGKGYEVAYGEHCPGTDDFIFS